MMRYLFTGCLTFCFLLLGFYIYKRVKSFNIQRRIRNFKVLEEFIVLLIFFYIFLVGSFGLIYYLIAADTLYSRSYFHWFYFSAITLATVGYGDIAPVNETMKFFVIIESFLGYISLPIIISLGISLIFNK